MTITLSILLTLIALVCGILMLVLRTLVSFPLAAIAIICLALVQSGLIPM